MLGGDIQKSLWKTLANSVRFTAFLKRKEVNPPATCGGSPNWDVFKNIRLPGAAEQMIWRETVPTTQNPNLSNLNFASVRDFGFSPSQDGTYLVTDDITSGEALPADRIIVKYAFTDKTRFGIVATGPLPKKLVTAILAERTGKDKGDFKIWRANGAFTSNATVYTLNVETGKIIAQAIDFTGTTGGDVIFDDDYQPYGVAMIRNTSVTRRAKDIAFE